MDFDSIDEKQAFKLGFAEYCAQQGMTPEEATSFAKKSAALPGWGETINQLGYLGIGVPAAAGMALGGGLGYGAAKLDEPDITPEDIKAKEIADTYKRYTDRLKSRRSYQQYRAARQIK
jgi:hypothetical protein